MKNIAVVFGAFLTLFLVSCEGDQGPPGPEGPEGIAGIQGQVFQVNGRDLAYIDVDNVYSTVIDFDQVSTFEVLPEDAVFIYRLETEELDNGSIIEAWSLLPQNFFLEEGTIQYVYNHTELDARILIEGNFDLINLSPDFVDNQTFRVAVVPSQAAQSVDMDESNINSVMTALGISEKDVQKIKMN